MHLEEASAGSLEASEAVLAALQSLHTLKSTPAGVQAILEEGRALPTMCQVLGDGNVEASKLVLDMLLHILMFSAGGYCVVMQVAVCLPCLGFDCTQSQIRAATDGSKFSVGAAFYLIVLGESSRTSLIE